MKQARWLAFLFVGTLADLSAPFVNGARAADPKEPALSRPAWLISPISASEDKVQVPGLATETSNNNLAIKVFDGRLYFAFRTAPHHHPKPPIWAPAEIRERAKGTNVKMYVVSAPMPAVVTPESLEALDWRLEFEVSQKLAAEIFDPMIAQFFQGTNAEQEKARAWFVNVYGDQLAREMFETVGSKASDDEKVAFRRRARPMLDDSDLREPIFYAMNGKLHFLFMQVAGKPMTFRALGTWHTAYDPATQAWSTPVPVLRPGEHFWEVQVRKENGQDVAYLSSTTAGHYGLAGTTESIHVHLHRSTDGVTWSDSNDADAIDVGGGSEPALTFEPRSHTAWALLRMELGDERGWGSLLGRADDTALDTSWKFADRADPRKFDSARLFSHEGEVYLIARQNVRQTAPGELDETKNAPFDAAFHDRSEEEGERERQRILKRIKSGELSRSSGSLAAGLTSGDPLAALGVSTEYMRRYYFEPAKRTALYHLNRETNSFDWLLTLPSAGDTAFPSVEDLGEGRFLVGNYSSDPNERLWSWREGQDRRTGIYLILLTLPDEHPSP